MSLRVVAQSIMHVILSFFVEPFVPRVFILSHQLLYGDYAVGHCVLSALVMLSYYAAAHRRQQCHFEAMVLQ